MLWVMLPACAGWFAAGRFLLSCQQSATGALWPYADFDLSLPHFADRRKLAKQTQTELANANSVADEVLSSMTTVLAHAAADSAKAAYHAKLLKFYSLQVSGQCLMGLPAALPPVLLNGTL